MVHVHTGLGLDFAVHTQSLSSLTLTLGARVEPACETQAIALDVPMLTITGGGALGLRHTQMGRREINKMYTRTITTTLNGQI